MTEQGVEMKHFLSYDSAREMKDCVVKLLQTEGYSTEYLKIEIVKDKRGFFIEASSEIDPQVVARFKHLLRERVKSLRSAVNLTI